MSKQRRRDDRSRAVRRSLALARRDLCQPSQPRSTAAGPFSPAVKVMDQETRDLIDEELRKRQEARAT